MPLLAAAPDARSLDAACPRCGQPADSRHFDSSGFKALPERGREAVLARVELAPQYCGLLEFFSQYTDAQARDAAQVETPGLQWLLRVNRQPLDPYVELEHIVNPWGFGSFQLAVRLPEGATVELVTKRALAAPVLEGVSRVGGRLCGRYWYDPSFGAAPRLAHGRVS